MFVVSVLMSVCPKDFEISFSKMLTNHSRNVVGNIFRNSFLFVFSLKTERPCPTGLKILISIPTRYNSLENKHSKQSNLIILKKLQFWKRSIDYPSCEHSSMYSTNYYYPLKPVTVSIYVLNWFGINASLSLKMQCYPIDFYPTFSWNAQTDNCAFELNPNCKTYTEV